MDYNARTIRPHTRWNRIIGRLCLFWNRCPRCNSDAPAVDCCVVCRNVHSTNEWGTIEPNRRQQYPPTLATKALWWYCWLHPSMDSLQADITRDHIRNISG